MNVKELYTKLKKSKMSITYSTLYLYCNGAVVPPYEVWQELNRKMGLNLTSVELQEMFEDSRQIQKEDNHENKQIYNLNTKIKPSIVNQKYKGNVELLKMEVERRADEVFSNQQLINKFKVKSDRKTSAYIAYLIEKDLKENGYFTEEGEDNEQN